MFRNLFILLVALLGFIACNISNDKSIVPRDPAFKDYHSALDSIIISSTGTIRNIALDANIDTVKMLEVKYHTELLENSDSALYYEFMSQDSTYSLSINYNFVEKKLLEAEIKMNHKDYNQSQLIYFNLIQFYSKKIGEPKKDKGFYIFMQKNEPETPVLAISDESDNLHNTINIHLYKDNL
jgi:hypothetical protein